MTRIDFYILAESAPQSRALFACRLADKAYRMKHPVYIHAESEQHAAHMDDLLWTFSQGSFLPHALSHQITTVENIPPIVIGHSNELPTIVQASTAVLINMASDVPLFFSHFERVAEIIDQSPTQKQVGRERYRFYRDRGYDLQSHNIAASAAPGILNPSLRSPTTCTDALVSPEAGCRERPALAEPFAHALPCASETPT